MTLDLPEAAISSPELDLEAAVGEIQLNLDKRLALSAIDTPQPPASS